MPGRSKRGAEQKLQPGALPAAAVLPDAPPPGRVRMPWLQMLPRWRTPAVQASPEMLHPRQRPPRRECLRERLRSKAFRTQALADRRQAGALGRPALTGTLPDASGSSQSASAGPSKLTIQNAPGFTVTDVRTHFAPRGADCQTSGAGRRDAQCGVRSAGGF